MNYATAADLRERYGDKVDTLIEVKTPEGFLPDERKLDQALMDASALIDSYLSGRYLLPLSVVPRVLMQQCCTIAYYYLNDERATDQVVQRYKDALRWLADVKRGEIAIGTDSDDRVPESGDLPVVYAEKAVFGRNQKGFV
ncbi:MULTISPECIES: gp436 family protein [Serratia]|uniref:gp436 family protein n=1 Tax=Serratia TaxID=613 RepID=UPI000660992A|nr:phage protein Gp36 family protein [Serratia sp. 506_PEND]